jgi:hypothetical protein
MNHKSKSLNSKVVIKQTESLIDTSSERRTKSTQTNRPRKENGIELQIGKKSKKKTT